MCVVPILLLASLHAAGLACSAEAELALAASTYRTARPIRYLQHIEVQVPGAPKHEETLDFGFDKDKVVMAMPSSYTIELRRTRFRIAEAGRHNIYVSAPAGDDLQASLEVAFGGGSPVIPPIVLLRRARTADERVQSFRLKVMGKFTGATCSDRNVMLAADNGTVRFRVEKDGLIREIQARIATAPGQPDITAKIEFIHQDGDRLPSFTARGRPVSSVAQLAQEKPVDVMPDITLRNLDGSEARLRDIEGRTTIVEFWATWCAPCRATLPRIAEFARTRKDVRVVLVNLSESAPLIRSYLAAAKIELPTLIDANGSLHQSFGGGLPLTIVFSADGHVLKRHAGFDEEFASWLREHV
jgi:thiol-disulfide isomerase/thioredoxin